MAPSGTLFQQALTFTLQQEGGYQYTQNTADRGLGTKAGLTSATVATYYGRTLSPAEMIALTPGDVANIYTKLYWLPFGFVDGDPAGLCVAVFDAGVLTGVGHAGMLLQSCLGVKVDGRIGPMTLTAMRQANAPILQLAFAQGMLAYLYNIVQHDATQQKWALGWYTRAIKPLSLSF